ncbi:MAG: VOC family protein [Alphaproteobacteria bacterium]|nr:VOC family protein [Alphaproteobacteria bacterium]
MALSLKPCFWLHDGAAEAVATYTSIFPNSRVRSAGPLVWDLEIQGQPVMLLQAGPMYRAGPALSLHVRLSDADTLRRAWDALCEGGKVFMPLQEWPWSPLYGWVEDARGIGFQLALVDAEDDGPRVIPGLLFVNERCGRARDALAHYTDLFAQVGGPDAAAVVVPPPPGDVVPFAMMRLAGTPVAVGDGPGQHAFGFDEGGSLFVGCQTQAEVDGLWEGLIADGGRESRCGWLVDRFGVSWQIVPTALLRLLGDPQVAGPVHEAMMGLNKLDIAVLEAAAAAAR